MLALMVMLSAVLLLPVALLSFRYAWLLQQKLRIENIFDAAALLAAKDVSRIYIDDPAFGLVGISNYPPIGKATIASDGEPLPVWGINNLVGTIRLNAILSDSIQSGSYRRLVVSDYEHLKHTIETLNNGLNSCLKEPHDKRFTDIDAVTISPLSDVKSFLNKELNGLGKFQSLELRSGWLLNGGGTLIPIPGSSIEAKLPHATSNNGEYQSFTDIPVENMSFTFAGVSKSPSIANSLDFKQQDSKHICSAIQLRALVRVSDPFEHLFGQTPLLEISTCALPCSLPDITPPGALTLRFPRGFLPGVRSFMDLLATSKDFTGAVTSYDVSGGDYPIDQGARFDAAYMDRSPDDCLSMFSESLYYWLRNGHCYPRIDALLAALAQPIDQESSSRFLIYEFERDGTISVRPMERDPFAEGMVSDQQSFSEFEGHSASGVLCSCYCRDQTKRLGAFAGGKHGGQPVVGYPLDWIEQSAYSGNELQAFLAGKGKMAAQLSVVQNSIPANATVTLTTQERAQLDSFQRLDGSIMPRQPRRSIYSGGLATDIEISIVRKPFLLRRQKSRNSST